jgi:hypothetical protein
VGEGEGNKMFINLFGTSSSVDTFQIRVRTIELFCESLSIYITVFFNNIFSSCSE